MLSLETAKDFLKTVRYPGCDTLEQSEYIQAHLTRILDTYRIIENLEQKSGQKVLDIGAKPYMLAALVKKYLPCSFIGVGYSIEDIRGVQTKTDRRYTASDTGPVPVISKEIPLTAANERFDIEMWQCNVETDPLPFPDNSMDIVVFSEILEHLIFNPALVIAEMNRVLKNDGTAIVTTPNQLYWVRLAKLFLGKNIDDPYSAHGPYGRHNRNYLPREITRLYTDQGFTRISTTTKTFLPLRSSKLQHYLVDAGNIACTLIPSRRGKQYVGVFRKTSHMPVPQYPGWLYH